jgi:hemoglobin
MRKTIFSVTAFVFFALLCLPQISHAATMKMKKSLYERLGGKKAIVAVVDDFVNNVGHDKRINHFFAKTVASKARLAHFKMELVNFICMATGGPCKYTGRNMKEAHAGMGITKADFNALVEDLVKTLNKFKVPKKEQNELLGLLGPLEPQIVTKK